MASRRCVIWGVIVVVIMLVMTVERGFGQTPAQQRARRPGGPTGPTTPTLSPPAGAAAGQAAAAGEERELVLEAAITGQPEKPLIQFQRNRPGVKFSEVRIGPTTRPFMNELVHAKTMEVSSPDIRAIFPNIFK